MPVLIKLNCNFPRQWHKASIYIITEMLVFIQLKCNFPHQWHEASKYIITEMPVFIKLTYNFPHQWHTAFALQASRWKVPGSIMGSDDMGTTVLSFLLFYRKQIVVFFEYGLKRPARRAPIDLYAQLIVASDTSLVTPKQTN